MPSWEKSCPANLCQLPHCLNECAKLWRQADGVSVYQTLECKTTEGTLRDKNLKCSELSKVTKIEGASIMQELLAKGHCEDRQVGTIRKWTDWWIGYIMTRQGSSLQRDYNAATTCSELNEKARARGAC